MVVERVGFHSNFGTFKRSRHLKISTRLSVTSGFPFNPTYDAVKIFYQDLYRAHYSFA